MKNKLFILDKILPFRKKVKKLHLLNLNQLYQQRFGIGKIISLKISLFSSVSSYLKVEQYKYNIINSKIKFIFLKSKKNLDYFLKKKMIQSLAKSVDLYDYRGSRYDCKLPINGQRRRANAKTSERVRPYVKN